MESIIWDWNGTLLNDLDFCISSINTLLKKRQLPLLDQHSYRGVFSFPVKNYYAAIGFDFEKEDFSIPAKEFIDLYNAGVHNCVLHSSAVFVLEQFRKKGIRQFVLSAMKQDMLDTTLKMKGIYDFFDGVAGLDDHYAVSKIERGEQLISKFKIDKNRSVIIGDTDHDYDVAKKLGINCILVADGHQSKARLKSTGARVFSDLSDILHINPLVTD